jgi:hypothetical protein
MSPSRRCSIPQGLLQTSKKGDACRSPEGGHVPSVRVPFLARQSAARPRTSRRTKFRWLRQARDRPFLRILTEKAPSRKKMSWLKPQDRAGIRNGDTHRFSRSGACPRAHGNPYKSGKGTCPSGTCPRISSPGLFLGLRPSPPDLRMGNDAKIFASSQHSRRVRRINFEKVGIYGLYSCLSFQEDLLTNWPESRLL